MAIRRGTKYFMSHLSIGRGKRNSNNRTCFLGVGIRCLRMRILSLYCLLILTSSLFLGTCFLSRMEIINYKLGCHTLTVYTMMDLPGTSLLIPLSLTPLMGLLNSSLPWWNSTSMFLTFLFSYNKLDLKDLVFIPLYISTGR